MFANAQPVGFIIHTGAEVRRVVTGADGDPVNTVRFRIPDAKIGEDRMFAEVFKSEGTVLTELLAEAGLPALQVKIFGLAVVGNFLFFGGLFGLAFDWA